VHDDGGEYFAMEGPFWNNDVVSLFKGGTGHTSPPLFIQTNQRELAVANLWFEDPFRNPVPHGSRLPERGTT